MIARWFLGSPFKTLWHELPSAAADPWGYAALARDLVRERGELAKAFVEILAEA